MVNKDTIVQSIRQMILVKMGITQPPYFVNVVEDVGSVTVQIFDMREPGGAYPGKYVAGHTMTDWHDTLIDEKTTQAAEAMRSALTDQEPDKEDA